jgi:hypothetical protein
VGARRPNPKLAKIHRTYTVEEMATLYGVHRNTVRAWLKQGLAAIDKERPLLVQGSSLIAFLQSRRTLAKRPCSLGEIYCVRCREPKRPAEGRVRYSPLTPTTGNLIGLCPTCDARLYRRTRAAALGQFDAVLQVALPEASQHIDQRTEPSPNSDFKPKARKHGNAQPQERADQAPVLCISEGSEAPG